LRSVKREKRKKEEKEKEKGTLVKDENFIRNAQLQQIDPLFRDISLKRHFGKALRRQFDYGREK